MCYLVLGRKKAANAMEKKSKLGFSTDTWLTLGFSWLHFNKSCYPTRTKPTKFLSMIREVQLLISSLIDQMQFARIFTKIDLYGVWPHFLHPLWPFRVLYHAVWSNLRSSSTTTHGEQHLRELPQ